MKGKKLEFISRIVGDGSSTVTVSKEYRKSLRKEKFKVTRLSLSNKTYIASGFNTFVVKMKSK